MKSKVKVKADPYTLIEDMLDTAVQSGMNKCDKYTQSLTDVQRRLLADHINNYFWVELEARRITLE